MHIVCLVTLVLLVKLLVKCLPQGRQDILTGFPGLIPVQVSRPPGEVVWSVPDVCKQFINDYLFADNAKLCKHVITDDDRQVLQKGLNTFHEWSDRWLLRLTMNKCKIAFYGRDVNYEYKYYPSSIALEGNVDVIKDLGVVLYSELSFVSHCKEKINKAYSMLALIKRNFYIFNRGGICYTI